MKTKEHNYFTTLAGTLVVLGIIFGSSDQLIGYSFFGAGVMLSIISVIKSRRKEQKSSLETSALALTSKGGKKK